ncbi:methylenetetrahydrofolate reductase (NADPH) [Danaus plexippus]|uniref:methylenetetrahydrofolate reductase (NADPH) n=1 Tax=Danaus plexippus TaxID=13037 RepID=UPI002AB2885B|nr:methylenetetrahydrofolate reductase (NADPH) [Danaus plexippus]
MSKITELISNSEKLSYSYEVTPSITYEKIKDIDILPRFFSVTWHPQEQDLKSFNMGFAPLKLATDLITAGHNVLLHVSCSFMTKKYLHDLLKFLQEMGICNLLIIRGENYDATKSDFTSHELIKYIRKLSGDYFCIGVAGFLADDEKLPHLKAKVESGANFILTQAFFQPIMFENFVLQCHEIDINIPILPGLFVFETKVQLNKLISLCKIKVSENTLISIKKHSGIGTVAKLILDLNKLSGIKHFHFFTINKMDITSKIIECVNSNMITNMNEV